MEKTQGKLRVVIFAGGVGTRMWPLSRKSTPKQFEKIIEDKSTLQLAVERVRPEVSVENIYISTGKQYKDVVKKQLPDIPEENIIGEPEMKDVAAAVGYLMAILAKDDPNGAVAILWSDHLVKHVDRFKNAIRAGADYIEKNNEVFVFLGQKPRFASQNLGWIEYGETVVSLRGFNVNKFISWHYRPSLEKATKYFKSKTYAWNPGYFIVAPGFVLDKFKEHMPKMYDGLAKLQESYGTLSHEKLLNKIYPTFEKISFDNAIIEKVPSNEAVVLPVDLGWSDIGAWEALKEALQPKGEENLLKGKVKVWETKNSLVYNYTDKLLTTLNIKDMVVVATNDVIMVVPQDSIPEVKKMLNSFKGTELEKYT